MEKNVHPVAPRRILVVENNQDMAVSLAAVLTHQGHVVKIANEGPTAIEFAEKEIPEVVLLDLGLPGMNGFEVATQLRRRGLADVLIIAASGYGHEEHLELAKAAGINHYLMKPLDFVALNELISHPA